MRTQQETFDSIEVEGVRTVYYYGGDKGWINEKEFSGMGNDSYYYMHDKFLDCLKNIDLSDVDFVFRTNSSSYVQKLRLIEFAKTLPAEKLYAGWEIKTNENFNIISGAGIFMSTDVIKILINNISPEFEKEEDYYIGSILNEQGIQTIDDKSRIDYTGGLQQQLVIASLQPYHIRFKTDNRLHDAENMRVIHRLLCS